MASSTLRVLLLTACTAATACADAEDAGLEPGRYEYHAVHPTPDGDSIRLHGVMEIFSVSPEAVEGQWDVPRLHPELEAAPQEAGYVITGRPTYFGTVVHRIAGDPAAGGLRCEGEYSWIAEGGIEREVPLACTLSRGVPEGFDPALPNPGTPIIREIDPDTVVPPLPPRPE